MAALSGAEPHSAFAGTAERLEFDGVAYRLFRARPEEVELHWKDASGQRYMQFSRLITTLEANGRKIEFTMNAGIFEPGGVPSGLHVENSVELLPLNLRDGKGNFYLKPTGVFAIADGKAVVMESAEYSRAGLKPLLALQSGPLLMRGGVVHPQFQKDSPNAKHRNGVGVTSKSEVVFAITEAEPITNRVNLHGFARLFAHLDCKDALFLDGDISEMHVNPAPNSVKPGNSLGAFLVVTKKRQ